MTFMTVCMPAGWFCAWPEAAARLVVWRVW